MEKGKKIKSALGRGLSALISTPAVPVHQTSGSAAVSITESIRVRMAADQDDSMDLNLKAVPARAPRTVATVEEVESHHGQKIQFIPVGSIVNNPTQPRQKFDDNEIKELSESIKTYGVLQPILVRPTKGEGEAKYEIVAGERRWRAAKLSALTEVPAIVQDLTDKETLEVSIVENVQRSNLSPIEEAEAYQRLCDEFTLTQQEVSDRVGKDRASVSNYIRLLKLPPDVLVLVRDSKLSMGHAKAILTIKEPAAQSSLARKTVEESLSVRALEDIVSRVVVLDTGSRNQKGKLQSNAGSEFNPFPEAIDRMRMALGTKVTIRHHASGRGRLEIEYFSEQELDRLVEHVCRT